MAPGKARGGDGRQMSPPKGRQEQVEARGGRQPQGDTVHTCDGSRRAPVASGVPAPALNCSVNETGTPRHRVSPGCLGHTTAPSTQPRPGAGHTCLLARLHTRARVLRGLPMCGQQGEGLPAQSLWGSRGSRIDGAIRFYQPPAQPPPRSPTRLQKQPLPPPHKGLCRHRCAWGTNGADHLLPSFSESHCWGLSCPGHRAARDPCPRL